MGITIRFEYAFWTYIHWFYDGEYNARVVPDYTLDCVRLLPRRELSKTVTQTIVVVALQLSDGLHGSLPWMLIVCM